jgi:sugar (pentulose or hexulose) kinase
MPNECLVALDAGSGSGRTAIFDLEGRLLGAAAEDWCPTTPNDEPMGAEFDPATLWSTLCRTTRQALDRAGISPSQTVGISVTSQRDGAVFLDVHGRELHCSANRDARGVMHAEEIAQAFGETIYRTTGRWPLGLDPMERLWWFREQRPDTYEQVSCLLMISDWLLYRLTDQLCSEPTNASSSMLFDVVSCSWSSTLADCLRYSSTIYPPCRAPGERLGSLQQAAAAQLGLPAGIPVAVGAADSQAASLACAAFDDGQTTVIAGTTMPVQMVLSRPVLDKDHRLHLGAYVTPGLWVLESNSGLAGVAYRWFCETFLGLGKAHYQRLEKTMAMARPGEVMAVVGPQIADFRELAFPPKSTFVFPFLAGVQQPPSAGSFGRAILENICFAARGNIEQLEQVSGQVVTCLNLCGGLARSTLLAQILAAVCSHQVHVPEVWESSSLGAAMCAAVGAGLYSSLEDAARGMVRWAPITEPDPEAIRTYRGLYRKWRKLYEQAREL